MVVRAQPFPPFPPSMTQASVSLTRAGAFLAEIISGGCCARSRSAVRLPWRWTSRARLLRHCCCSSSCSWTGSRIAVSAAIAVVVRHRTASLLAVIVAGALLGLVGSRLELLDLYLTRDGWAAFDALDAITVALSALAAWYGGSSPARSMRWCGASFVPRTRIRGPRKRKPPQRWPRRLSFDGFAQRAAVAPPPLLSCIVTEEIWLPGELSAIDWVLPVVLSDRCAEKYGPVARAEITPAFTVPAMSPAAPCADSLQVPVMRR